MSISSLKLDNFLHESYRYHIDDGFKGYQKKLNEGVNELLLSIYRLPKSIRKGLIKISSNSKVNIFSALGFEYNFQNYKVFENIQSYIFKFEYMDLIRTKTGYTNIKKRMIKSPCLSFRMSTFDFETKALRRKSRDIVQHINQISFEKIFVHVFYHEEMNVSKYQAFLKSMSVSDLKLMFRLTDETSSPIYQFKQIYHPAIFYGLARIEIGFDVGVFNVNPLRIFPFKHFKETVALRLDFHSDTSRVNVTKVIAWVLLRCQKVEIENDNKYLVWSNEKFPNNALVKMIVSSRNVSGKVGKDWIKLVNGCKTNNEYANSYLKQIEQETNIFLKM